MHVLETPLALSTYICIQTLNAVSATALKLWFWSPPAPGAGAIQDIKQILEGEIAYIMWYDKGK